MRTKIHGELDRTKDQFCCLGVLCDLHAKAGKGEWTGGHYISSETHLPLEVRLWAGLNEDSPELPSNVSCTGFRDGDHCRRHLVSINDRGGSFEEIATLIEAHL